MMHLAPENCKVIRPLFADYPYLQGLVHGALSGAFGEAFVDQAEDATVGMIGVLDFVFFAGDASCAIAATMIGSRSAGSWLIGRDGAWQSRFGEIWGEHLRQKERSDNL